MFRLKPRFSLRTLFIVTTVVAIITAFVATHVRIVLGFGIALLWLVEFAGGPIVDFFEAWPELTKRKLAKPLRDDENAIADEHE